MTLCPIALVSGCKKCFMVNACPLKTVIGNFEPEPPATESTETSATDEKQG
ncbi:MAG: hypothetical protein ACI8W8_003319 [Rhodothermales bacterium]|jgi:hypothetical protein